MWANIESASITAARPKAVLFSHHRQIKRPVPYQSLFKVDLNGMWIERLPDGTQILKAGTYRYRNHYENTNTPLPVGQIVDAFEGVVTARSRRAPSTTGNSTTTSSPAAAASSPSTATALP